MEENDKPDGSTAMEQLCRELAGCVLSCDDSAARWAEAHGIDCDDVLYTVIRDDARSDIKRRIEDARAEDDCSDSYAAAALKALTGMHRGHDMCTRGEVDEMVAVVEGWKAKADELDALKSAGRVMPEGLSWPRYDDGRPVLLGDEVDGDKVAWVVLNSIRYEICNRDNSCLTTDLYGKPVERPAPKAVGADGVEVKAGETVWLAREHLDKADMSPSDSGFECGLLGVGALDPLSVKSVGKKLDKDGFAFFTEHGAWCPASWLTHEPADSWGRLREDAVNDFTYYWGCHASPCLECPCKTGGKNPKERYGVGSCRSAMHLDLVARAERLAGVRADA